MSSFLSGHTVWSCNTLDRDGDGKAVLEWKRYGEETWHSKPRKIKLGVMEEDVGKIGEYGKH